MSFENLFSCDEVIAMRLQMMVSCLLGQGVSIVAVQ